MLMSIHMHMHMNMHTHMHMDMDMDMCMHIDNMHMYNVPRVPYVPHVSCLAVCQRGRVPPRGRKGSSAR
jgi:hypothetical protein